MRNKSNKHILNEDDILVENETHELKRDNNTNNFNKNLVKENTNYIKINQDQNEKFVENKFSNDSKDGEINKNSNMFSCHDNLFLRKTQKKLKNSPTHKNNFSVIKKSESLLNDEDEEKNSNNKFEEKKIKLEEINISKVLKRVLENNKREASVRHRELYSCYPKSYLNLNHNSYMTQTHFFIGANQNSRPSTEIPNKPYLNSIEFSLQNIPLWKKHEEIWINVSSFGFFISPELEKYLLPPNEYDVLLSTYCKINNKFSDKIVINDLISNPNEEMNNWKNAYKKAVMRWHPDKLFPLIEALKLKDENKKGVLKKKAGHIMNNMYKMMQNILEILKKIIKRKENNY